MKQAAVELGPDQVEFCDEASCGRQHDLVERRAAFILTSVFQEGKGRKK